MKRTVESIQEMSMTSLQLREFRICAEAANTVMLCSRKFISLSKDMLVPDQLKADALMIWHSFIDGESVNPLAMFFIFAKTAYADTIKPSHSPHMSQYIRPSEKAIVLSGIPALSGGSTCPFTK